MSLTEAQIIRYSRQILLAQVGGKGQERLLASGAKLVGQGSAQATAAAYLAVGGIPVRAAQRAPPESDAKVRSDETGFLFAKADVGRPIAAALDEAVADLNADALSDASRGLLGELPADFSGVAPWVALGWRQGRGEVVYRSERGCADCFTGQLRGLTKVPPGPQSVLVGTVGALVFQRLCLGASDDLGVVAVDPDGELQTAAVNPCSRCA
jgi:molybdopterin-synthase adenylyltransferase